MSIIDSSYLFSTNERTFSVRKEGWLPSQSRAGFERVRTCNPAVLALCEKPVRPSISREFRAELEARAGFLSVLLSQECGTQFSQHIT
jgi:hypothetical protein